MGLKWVNQYCNTTQFVIKMDDDIIVNMMKVLDLLKKFNDKENFIGGYVLKGLQAKRERANKWFVTKEEYPMDIYPPFVSGWFYVTTPTLCKKIEQLSYAEKYFWIDDVFVTGILTQKIHVKMYDLKEYFTDHPEYFQCCMNDLTKYKFDCDILVGPNGGRTDLFYEFNKAFSICTQGNCLERPSPVSKSCYYNSKSLNLGKGSGVISTYKLI
ncbi:hypothetical protein HHI36_022019 [Cryptolaemus montrouzieri]|uniref:Hexosyltransferase n=1 Tax=Cryptolaemus montrouzieri TaxID=559131 RepID=A0ABD2MZG7_9CUCU